MKLQPNKRVSQHQLNTGFALPLVLVVGLIMTVGGFAMLARSFGGLIGPTRLEQSRQAKAIAEAGIARTIESLNRDYNYLLINCYSQNSSYPTECQNKGTWIDPLLPSSICPDTEASGTPALTRTSNTPTGEYVIDFYTYSGTQFYGGTGTLRVIGYRKSNDNSKILSSAAVEMSFDIKPKPCGARYDAPPTSSGFPGLMASSITMGGNDVIGQTSGNILCTKCESPTYVDTDNDGVISAEEYSDQNGEVITCNNQCEVGGSIFIGDVSLPEIEFLPSNLGLTDSKNINLKCGDVTILDTGSVIIDSTLSSYGNCSSNYEGTSISAEPAVTNADGETEISNVCAFENDSQGSPIKMHCRLGHVLGSGKNTLTIENNTLPINLYVEGDITLSGSSSLLHDGSASMLSLFGLPAETDIFGADLSSANSCNSDPDTFLQDVTLSGGSNGTNFFAYFPCGLVGINGGSKDNCADPDDDYCGGGDIRGAVWAKEWNGSSGNKAQLVVPPDLPSELMNRHGNSFAISVRDYVALGVNSWFSFGL